LERRKPNRSLDRIIDRYDRHRFRHRATTSTTSVVVIRNTAATLTRSTNTAITCRCLESFWWDERNL